MSSVAEPTLIGRVRHVLGAQITAELREDVAGTTPLFRGRVYHIGQIGSLVRIPQGTFDLIGAVTMLGIAELTPPLAPSLVPHVGDRWLQFHLLGEIDAVGTFRRGISTYPSIDDSVHFATHEQIIRIFPPPTHGYVRLGALSTSQGDAVHLDLGRLVVRHSAVVGSTGSGKSSTVASLLQSLIGAGLHRANIVVIDPHGEYSSALGPHANIRSVTGTGASALSIPYWALGVDDLLAIVARGAERNTIVRNRVQELVLKERQAFLQTSSWSAPRPGDITADTPTPFDLREVWYQLDFDNRATFPNVNGTGSPLVVHPGNAAALQPAQFQTYSPGSAAPYKGKTFGHYNPFPDRLRSRLSDPRFAFLWREWPDPTAPDPLALRIAEWLGNEKPISLLDFSGVPSEAADIAIGVVLNLLFVAAAHSSDDDGVGKSRPILVVLEEAHRFLGANVAQTAGLAKDAAERIAREGRKYGLGIMIVSQRPSELSDTVLSQCATFIALRLTNTSDQGTIKAALPDVVANLAEALPALRTGEALVTGEAIALPTRVLIDRPNPEPRAEDPSIASWDGVAAANNVERAIARWRGVPTPANTPGNP